MFYVAKNTRKPCMLGLQKNLKLRWAGHKSDCKLGYTKKCAVSKHLRAEDHPVDAQLKFLDIIAIESVDNEKQLLARET